MRPWLFIFVTILAASLTFTASGAYTYNTAGLLTQRQVANRITSITARDGEGRPLNITNTLNAVSVLAETLAWSGDGLLTNHTLVRGDLMTDHRCQRAVETGQQRANWTGHTNMRKSTFAFQLQPRKCL